MFFDDLILTELPADVLGLGEPDLAEAALADLRPDLQVVPRELPLQVKQGLD